MQECRAGPGQGPGLDATGRAGHRIAARGVSGGAGPGRGVAPQAARRKPGLSAGPGPRAHWPGLHQLTLRPPPPAALWTIMPRDPPPPRLIAPAARSFPARAAPAPEKPTTARGRRRRRRRA